MTGKVLAVAPERFDDCINFVAPREARCITLASNLVSKGIPTFPERRVKEFVYLSAPGAYKPEIDPATHESIDGVLVMTNSGILLHCFREGCDFSVYRAALSAFLLRNGVRCIIGTGEGTRLLESLLLVTPQRAIDYQLMTLTEIPGKETETRIEQMNADGGLHQIRKASPSDAEKLLPLQEGYEKEEVLPPGDPFDRKACLSNLKHMLERQHINIATASGIPVAKAGSNARGLHWDQIGGVYTSPDWRNKGLATALVARTSREMMSEGRKVALFVKLTNLPARKAYEKTGFKPDCLFRITYY